MASSIQRRRGTTSDHSTFTGAVGEITIDTTKDTVVVHDGAVVGGVPLLREDGSNSSLALGSQGVPSLKFSGDPNTGIYSPGANQVAVATNGTQRLTIDTAATTSTLPVVHPLGAVGTPSITFTGDLNTGIYSPTADTLAFVEGGSEVMRITSSGLVGIGTSSPGDLLTVSTTGGSHRIRVERSGTTVATGQDCGGISFYTNDADNPSLKTWDIYQFSRGSIGLTDFYVNEGATNRLLIQHTTGNVGIGTSAPDVGLHYRGDTPKLRIESSNTLEATAGTEEIGRLEWEGFKTSNFTVAASIRARQDGTWSTSTQWIAPAALEFYTQDNTGVEVTTPRMLITSAGNVGIGTTSVTNLLHLRSDSSSNVDHLYLQNRNGGANSGARIAFSNGNSDYGDNRYAYIGAINTGASENGNHLVFAPNANGASATEKARIDSSGRLLVGTSTALAAHAGTVPIIQTASSTATNTRLGSFAYGNDPNPSGLHLCKSRGATVGTHGLVNDGDNIAFISFDASDGTNFIRSALISAQVDGTPGTNDMPGRLVFSTTADGASSPTERLRITSGGYFKASNAGTYGGVAGTYHELRNNVGSGTLVLQMANTSATGNGVQIDINSDGTSYAYLIGYSTSAAANRIIIWSNGNVVNTNNSYGAISDIKLKENIVDANSQWDDLKALQVRNYNFKEGQTHTQIGLVAQEVELVSPGLVSESPDRDEEGNDLGTVTKSVNYSVLYMKAVKALQEAMERIEALEAKVTALEGA